jgi:hypothetical protein
MVYCMRGSAELFLTPSEVEGRRLDMPT